MSDMVPSKIFLTRGMGQHKEKLASFERALRQAGVAPFNLVKISSIFPPHCKLISKEEGMKLLRPGQIVFLVMSQCDTDEPHRVISASIGLAIPNDSQLYGYLSEHHSYGQNEKEAGQYAEDLAAYMLATTLGKKFDTSQIWDEENNIYQISEDITVHTQNITQNAVGKNGVWTTAFAAAVCIIGNGEG
jgi:arginine decarboxylase